MFRRKKSVEICTSCDRQVRADMKVCKCGAATKYMDFNERASYEVEQWRRHQAASAAS